MTAPLDHVAKGYDRICEPGGTPHIVCQLWPQCQCGEDCTDRRDAMLVRRFLIGLMVAVAMIATGLLLAGLR